MDSIEYGFIFEKSVRDLLMDRLGLNTEKWAQLSD